MMKEVSSDARKAITLATSSAVQVRSTQVVFVPSIGSGVTMPGETQLTVTPVRPSSIARVFVNMIRPAFEEA